MKRINHKLQTVISHMQNVQSWFDGARTDTSVKLAAATDEKALSKYQERAAYIDEVSKALDEAIALLLEHV